MLKILLTKALNARHGTQGWYFFLAHPRSGFSSQQLKILPHCMPLSCFRLDLQVLTEEDGLHRKTPLGGGGRHSNMSWVTWISMFGFLFSPSQRVVPSHLPVCWYLPLLILLTISPHTVPGHQWPPATVLPLPGALLSCCHFCSPSVTVPQCVCTD